MSFSIKGPEICQDDVRVVDMERDRLALTINTGCAGALPGGHRVIRFGNYLVNFDTKQVTEIFSHDISRVQYLAFARRIVLEVT